MTDIERRTPPKRSTKPIARSPLPARSKPIARGEWKPKRPKARAKTTRRRAPNEFPDEVKANVRRRSGNVCEICHTAKATDFHHRKLRAHGDNRECNCLHLCADCHTQAPHAVHRNVGKSYLMGWLVRSEFDPAEVPVKRAGRLP